MHSNTTQRYTAAFERAWYMLTEWVASGNFSPCNEEDIQCFLFHGIVVELGTAVGVRTKASSGNLWLGTKHFPDLVLGLNPKEPELIVEIKYRSMLRKAFFNSCKSDIEKMKKYYDTRPHRFVLFDENPYFVILDQSQYNELSESASPNCKILHFPFALNPSTGNVNARKSNAVISEA
ncbi:MAG: hypothetical protein Q8S96_17830 [Hydrogenophaga sp.]|uniref:hypothetical protein n=1 Tax=Hydrogenophaga sp. TaxID=1904254 RepID=UPI00271851EC|nr:hypothetical protein [Hydrogenophaga sp.]MDO9481070.1 hypothetical protein [Hydrogenophaga sp.]MDP3346299.1 hypothetical protein [Hydrogenophaga sp.]MDP3806421.1 hypothetical protein [Hydrogenophaga sp.]MDP3923692.1 hypothetical protein [Hydrogenophaga sp.]